MLSFRFFPFSIFCVASHCIRSIWLSDSPASNTEGDQNCCTGHFVKISRGMTKSSFTTILPWERHVQTIRQREFLLEQRIVILVAIPNKIRRLFSKGITIGTSRVAGRRKSSFASSSFLLFFFRPRGLGSGHIMGRGQFNRGG